MRVMRHVPLNDVSSLSVSPSLRLYMRHLVLPATHVCHASCQVWAIFGDSDRVFVGSPTPSFAFLFLNNTFSKVGVGMNERFGQFSAILTEFLWALQPPVLHYHLTELCWLMRSSFSS